MRAVLLIFHRKCISLRMSSKDLNWLKCYNGQMKSLQFKTLIRLLLSYLRLCVRTFLAICIYVFPVHETIIQNFEKKHKGRRICIVKDLFRKGFGCFSTAHNPHHLDTKVHFPRINLGYRICPKYPHPLLITLYFSSRNPFYKKGKRKVQGVPQSQTAAPPRPQEEEETDKSKQAQTEQTHEKHQN